MEKPMSGLGKEYTNPQERERFLKDNADAVVQKSYMKPFSAEELQGHKEALADTCMKIADIEAEKQEAMREFKDRLTPLQEDKNGLLDKIRMKAEMVSELCYKFVNQEERTTYFYNSLGDCIEARPCTADELQGTVFSQLRATGTDNV